MLEIEATIKPRLSPRPHRTMRVRSSKRPSRTRLKREAPPPPPPPPPPSPESFNRRVKTNRRDILLAGGMSLSTCLGFLLATRQVTAPIDRKPQNEVLQTRVKRNEMGQLFVETKDGDWMCVRPSSMTGGILYFRDRVGHVYRLQVQDRVQVDLSDDDVAMDLFGDGQWENSLEKLYKQNGDEVVLTNDEFIRTT